MPALIPITLFGWPVLSVLFFACMRTTNALVASVIGGWMFLPFATYNVPGLPPYDKFVASALGGLLGAGLIRPGPLLAFRPSLWDLPMGAWMAVPFISSMVAHSDAYDGVSAVLEQFFSWGLPYLLGRAYLRTPEHLFEMARGVAVAALLYLPLVLWEARMSPRLHLQIYGERQHVFSQTRKFGGWRPMVFTQHGLALTLFMASGALCMFWLVTTRAWRRMWGLSAWFPVVALYTTVVVCRSVASIALLVAGTGALIAVRRFGTRLGLVVLIVIPLVYTAARSSRLWDGSELATAAGFLGEAPLESVTTRLDSEGAFLRNAARAPWVGFSRSGWKVLDSHGRLVAIPDAMWVIALMRDGYIGLISFQVVLIIPSVLLLARWDRNALGSAPAAGVVVLSTCVLMFLNDCLFNAMLNPLYLLAAGGVVSALTSNAVRDGYSRQFKAGVAPGGIEAADLGRSPA